MQPPANLNAALRRLPKVDEVLATPAAQELLQTAPRWAVVAAIRVEIDRLRQRLRHRIDAVNDDEIAPLVDGKALRCEVDALLRPSLRAVLNATGVVLHTNLGRAPLAPSVLARVHDVARGYSNLEYELDERRRGSRHEHVTHILTQLTGAEDALVVNNCAGAVLLALSSLAQGREVIVSRGELIEIGGAFRVPDVMRASGARLVEVGTTNRTHARDYGDAITGETALLLKVHRSNFAQVGFTAEVSVAELAALGAARAVPVMMDLGSGALTDLRALGLGDEPSLIDVVKAGADVVACSGDKLLGGPQAGILVGKTQLIAPMKKHPLLRALRPDKLTLAALEATLELYRDGRSHEIPALAMLTTPEPTLKARAQRLSALCQEFSATLAFTPARVRSAVGGGALPLCEPWSWAVAVSAAVTGAAGGSALSAEALDARLRHADPPLIGRIADDRLLLDVRTLGDDDLPAAARALRTAESLS